MSKQNKTGIFLGREPCWQEIQIQLRDVQGLWGGRNIFVVGSGKTIVQSVYREPSKRSGLLEKRYSFLLENTKVKRLINAFIENDFVSLRTEDQLGIPDEARPEIVLVNAKGEHHKVAKWATHKNERLEKIYEEILRIESEVTRFRPIAEGKYTGVFVLHGSE